MAHPNGILVDAAHHNSPSGKTGFLWIAVFLSWSWRNRKIFETDADLLYTFRQLPSKLPTWNLELLSPNVCPMSGYGHPDCPYIEIRFTVRIIVTLTLILSNRI